jgi:hypothetical protein
MEPGAIQWEGAVTQYICLEGGLRVAFQAWCCSVAGGSVVKKKPWRERG